MAEKEGPPGPDEAQLAAEALLLATARGAAQAARRDSHTLRRAEKNARAEEARWAEEADRARQVAREAAERHAEIGRQFQLMVAAAGEAAGEAAHARQAEDAARTEAVLRVEAAERATRAADEAAARREETLLRAQRLAARVQEFASRAEESRGEMEAALREEARALSRARQAREVREEVEARHAAVAREANEASLGEKVVRTTRDGPPGVVAFRTAQSDRIVIPPESPSIAPSGESEGALAIGEEPWANEARPRISGYLKRGHPMLSLSMLVVIAGAIVLLGGPLLRGNLLSERRPASEVSGTDPGIVVPELAGLTASQARVVLVTVNLRLGGIVPVQGEPGVVGGTRPATGAVVGRGEAVTLLIGVEPDRLEQET